VPVEPCGFTLSSVLPVLRLYLSRLCCLYVCDSIRFGSIRHYSNQNPIAPLRQHPIDRRDSLSSTPTPAIFFWTHFGLSLHQLRMRSYGRHTPNTIYGGGKVQIKINTSAWRIELSQEFRVAKLCTIHNCRSCQYKVNWRYKQKQ